MAQPSFRGGQHPPLWVSTRIINVAYVMHCSHAQGRRTTLSNGSWLPTQMRRQHRQSSRRRPLLPPPPQQAAPRPPPSSGSRRPPRRPPRRRRGRHRSCSSSSRCAVAAATGAALTATGRHAKPSSSSLRTLLLQGTRMLQRICPHTWAHSATKPCRFLNPLNGASFSLPAAAAAAGLRPGVRCEGEGPSQLREARREELE